METRNCQNCKQNFNIEPDDFSFYEKIKVPPPTFCPECRLIRRMAWRNERNWHKRICDVTGKSIISSFSKDCPYKVYDLNYWKSDAFDPMIYGSDYNFEIDFFSQFNDLLKKVPHPNLIQKNNVDCDYSNYSINCKNCYVVASAVSLEDCFYALGSVTSCKKSFDIHQSNDCESSYEIVDCIKCYELFFGQNCEGCISSYFLYDCRNSSNCIGCVGLRNASYSIFNKQYTKEEYMEEKKRLQLNTREGLSLVKATFEELKKSSPRKYAIINKAENCIGDDINNARNCKNCFYARSEVENIRYSFKVFGNTKDGYDGVVVWDNAELFCECMSVTGQRVYFSQLIWGGFDIEYSYNCFDCNNIFGCVGLRNKSYCIFNTQYTKEEYRELVSKIKEQMQNVPYINKNNIIYKYGEFFPSEFSPYGYNDSLANDYFSLNKENALKSGFNWQEKEEKNYNVTISKGNIPNTPTETIVNEILECSDQSVCTHNCSTAFRIVPQELAFYRNYNVPLPEFCPSCRHKKRVELKNPFRLWHRQCMKEGCENTFETSYAPDRPEKVYCERCYQQEVL